MLNIQEKKRLDWESSWIDDHAKGYRGPAHIQQVKSNIHRRYVRVHLITKLGELRRNSRILREIL